MKTAAILIVSLALMACRTPAERVLAEVQPPVVVTKVVEKRIPLPAWATEPLPNQPPADGTVEALKNANNRRADLVDYANCRSRLLIQLDKGEKVSGKECRK